MDSPAEVSFPRGGRKAGKPAYEKRLSGNLFAKSILTPAKKKRSAKAKDKGKKSAPGELPARPFELSSAELWTYKDIPIGVVVLGCVRSIFDVAVLVTLPGRLSGHVKVDKISQPYNKIQNEVVTTNNPNIEGYLTLSEMFKIGQMVAVKVLSFVKDGTHRLELSMMPEDINSSLTHLKLHEENILYAAVSSIEDHGYVMDTGVPNCRAFLPKAKIDKGRNYCVGQIVRCMIENVNSSPTISTVSLSAYSEKINSKTTSELTTLDTLTPGSKVAFFVEKVLKNGLEGQFLDHFLGYIHEAYLEKPTQSVSKFKVGQMIYARLLYTIPTTKLSYFTLRGLGVAAQPALEKGSICSAKIISKEAKGFYLKLEKEHRGFVSFKRLAKVADSKNEENILKKYPSGSKHTVRLLDYDQMECVYVCSMEYEMINENYFTSKDLKCGEIVSGTVQQIKENGLVVGVGRLNGFVQDLHNDDTPVTNMKVKLLKFPIGRSVKARILGVDEDRNTFYLTLKPAIIHCQDPLTSLESVDLGKTYTGTLLSITDRGLRVQFCNLISGFVPKNLVCLRHNPDLAAMFYVGQPVNCNVHKIEDGKLTLTMLPKMRSIKIGNILNATVSGETRWGLDVVVNEGETDATIPTYQFTRHRSLAKTIQERYKEGDELKVISLTTGEDSTLLMSASECKFAKIINKVVCKEDEIVRCYVDKCMSDEVVLSPIASKFQTQIIVSKEETCDSEIDDLTCLRLRRHQTVVAKIIDNKDGKLYGSMKLSDVWKKDWNYTLDFMEDYMTDVEFLHSKFKKDSMPIGKLSLGQKVSGKVRSIHGGICEVTLESNAKAVAFPQHFDSNLVVGDEVNGVVLWLDFPKNEAVVSLEKKVTAKVNQQQDVKLPVVKGKKYFKAEILLFLSDFIVTVLKSFGQKQLVFLPKKVHENDFFSKGSVSNLKISDVVDVAVQEDTHKKIGYLRTNLEMDGAVNKLLKRKSAENPKGSKNKKLKKDIKVEEEIKEEIKEGSDDDDDGDDDEKPSSSLLPGVENFWKVPKVEQESEDDSDDEKKKPVKKDWRKMTPAEKAAAAKEEDERLRKVEEELLHIEEAPQSADHFDRLVLSRPNDSKLWIQYIAYHLQAAEIEKARVIARKALEKIEFKEEDEKLKVWIALLNLENHYGTKETFKITLLEAARNNEPVNVYLPAMEMLMNSGKVADFLGFVPKLRPKFKHNAKVWMELIKLCFQSGNPSEAHSLFDSALKALQPKEHVTLIVQFALLESRFGEMEKSESHFELLVSTYPKRVDIWITYVDLLVKNKKTELARRVLGRAVNAGLHPKKAKMMYKKFLQFEETHGNLKSVNKVRQSMLAYVESCK